MGFYSSGRCAASRVQSLTETIYNIHSAINLIDRAYNSENLTPLTAIPPEWPNTIFNFYAKLFKIICIDLAHNQLSTGNGK